MRIYPQYSSSQPLSEQIQAQSPNITISVNGKSIEVERAKLRLWFDLEDLRSKLKEAAEEGDSRAVSSLICSYLSVASDEEVETFQNAGWEEVAMAFAEISVLNSTRKQFPLFSYKSEEPTELVSWEYEGRTWYLWVHTLAKAYGWTEEYISELEIETGLALIQETMVEDQLRREWEWSLTELAYPYNKVTKTSKFSPLPRPGWMGRIVEEPKKTKLVKAWLPIGNIENLSGMGLHGTDKDVAH